MRLTRLCARSPVCADLHGSSLDRIKRLLAQLRTDGGRVTPTNVAFVMDSGGLDPLAYRDLDAAARAYVHAHDTRPLERLVDEAYSEEEGAGGRARGYSQGLFAAASCSDNPQAYDMRLQPPERVADWHRALERKRTNDPKLYAPFSVDEYLGIPIDYAYLQLCTTWPVASKQHPAGHPVPPNTRFPNVPGARAQRRSRHDHHAARRCTCGGALRKGDARNRRQYGARYGARRLLRVRLDHRSPLRADRKGCRGVRPPRAGASPRAGILSHDRRSRSGKSVARKSRAGTRVARSRGSVARRGRRSRAVVRVWAQLGFGLAWRIVFGKS